MSMNQNSSITIISWNIQSTNCGLTGSKFDDPEFCKIIENSQFTCLQEIRQPVTHPGYRVYNNTRNNDKYGGVCIMIRNSISRGVKRVHQPTDDVIACKLDKNFFGLNNDLYLVNSYIKPAYTSSITSNTCGLEILSALDDFITNLLNKGDVIMCGDFNARIGKECDFIINDQSGAESFVPLPDDYIPQNLRNRNSKDKNTNSYKKPFLELLINNKMHILNGRTLGDSIGDFTCIKHNGASVVDYFAISPDSSKYISHMSVQPFTPFSDHKPLHLKLTFSNFARSEYKQLHEAFDPAPPRYKTDLTSLADFSSIANNYGTENAVNDILSSQYDKETDETYRLNQDITKYIHEIANQCIRKTKVPLHSKSMPINRKPWFTPATRTAKQELLRATDIVSQFPDSDYLRKNFYRVKKTYRKLVDRNKEKFFDKLNTEIESGKVLNWAQFKKLKTHKATVPKFDSLDMENFENFFTKLYSNVHGTISQEKKAELSNKAEHLNNLGCTEQAQLILNCPIKLEEVVSTIATLKNGKSSSDDLISNEILKALPGSSIPLLVKLFNQCLDSGTYPWNNSIITPLHKKGCKSDPDNYRAVAVGSTVGKVFSTILLNRILQYKKDNNPDPHNQLGFSKGAQTYDHILTLQTITNKYKKLNKPVYAVFVDFRKAFDSVCREALFLKLAKFGIRGKCSKS